MLLSVQVKFQKQFISVQQNMLFCQEMQNNSSLSILTKSELAVEDLNLLAQTKQEFEDFSVDYQIQKQLKLGELTFT